jgi:hypothetical protein
VADPRAQQRGEVEGFDDDRAGHGSALQWRMTDRRRFGPRG